MERKEKLSIAIPTRNCCLELTELLDSIQRQITQQPPLSELIKIHIFDNNSTDDTAELISTFDLPLIYKKNETEISIVDQIFQAYEEPTGQYIWIVGENDLLVDGAIEIILAQLEKFEPALLIFKMAGYQNLVQMPSCFTSYQDFVLFSQHYNPHLLLENMLISMNVIRKGCFDEQYARKYQQESHAHLRGIVSGVKKDCGKIVYNQQQMLHMRQQHGNVMGSSIGNLEKIIYLKWLKQEYDLRGIVPERVIADYNLRLYPLVPKVSILINFEMNENITVDENLKILNQTIESVLAQDYYYIEIIVNSHCYFWSEYMDFAREKQLYGKTVQYAEVPFEANYELVKQLLNGDYIMLMNVGEYLTDHTYITSAVKIMIANEDISISFANYSLLKGSSALIQEERGLDNIDIFSEQSCTKISGQWLFANYDKLWCRPCTTIFKQELFFGDLGRYLKNINKLMFPWMFVESNIAFHNKVVAKCPDEFEKSSGILTLESYSMTLEYIDLAVMNALVCDYPKEDLQKWRKDIVKKYCLGIIHQADQNIDILIGLYEVARKNGVAHLLHESMSEIARDFNRMTSVKNPSAGK
ncbi:glycosyltransferase family 2 protein [Pelosinus sp. sgz500959]|uniref:glycosyltransferase family 2 protein n=1 Tax=Pelosinus sp. sgz500959 TaxID=3242472 RepID=UPI003670C7E6